MFFLYNLLVQIAGLGIKIVAVFSPKIKLFVDGRKAVFQTLEDKINALIESRKMIKNGSYFAFTATPKNKTLETFGVRRKYIKDGGEKIR